MGKSLTLFHACGIFFLLLGCLAWSVLIWGCVPSYCMLSCHIWLISVGSLLFCEEKQKGSGSGGDGIGDMRRLLSGCIVWRENKFKRNKVPPASVTFSCHFQTGTTFSLLLPCRDPPQTHHQGWTRICCSPRNTPDYLVAGDPGCCNICST